MDVQIQPRDRALFWMTYWVGDGFFPRRHIWPLFFPEARDEAAMRKRLSKLKRENFIFWPTHSEYRDWRIPEPVIFLDWRGILDVADQMGLGMEPPKNPQFKKHLDDFARGLKEKGIIWRRIAPMSPAHDLKAIDVRLAFNRPASQTPNYLIEERVPESHFRQKPDTVAFTIKRRDGTVIEQKRQVIPDDFMLIANQERQSRGEPHQLRALFEIDMSSHSNPAFSIEKVGAYAAYIGSPQYEARFGSKSGRWFVITTGERRMENLIRTTEEAAGARAKLFYFSFFDLVETQNVFTAPIWWQSGVGGPFDLENVE